MQTMWTYCLLPQGEVGARGLPGAPGDVSKIPVSSILSSHNQAVYDITTMEEMILLHSVKLLSLVCFVFTGGKRHQWAWWTCEWQTKLCSLLQNVKDFFSAFFFSADISKLEVLYMMQNWIFSSLFHKNSLVFASRGNLERKERRGNKGNQERW